MSHTLSWQGGLAQFLSQLSLFRGKSPSAHPEDVAGQSPSSSSSSSSPWRAEQPDDGCASAAPAESGFLGSPGATLPSLLFTSLKPPEPHTRLWGRSGAANGAGSTRKEGRQKHQAQAGWETSPLQREPLLRARAHRCGALRAWEHPCIAGGVKKGFLKPAGASTRRFALHTP